MLLWFLKHVCISSWPRVSLSLPHLRMFYDSVLTEDSFACTLCAICALCTCVWDNPVKLQE